MAIVPKPKARKQKAAPAAPRSADRDTGADDDTGSTSDGVFTSIKALILSNELRPGGKLVHEELAVRLGVSRTPVREALERLAQDGLVKRITRRGYYVAEIGFREARELYQVREALEMYALDLTFEAGYSDSDLEVLSELLRRYTIEMEMRRPRERMVVDRDFHMTLAGLAKNEYISSILDRTFERLIMKRRIDGYLHDRAPLAQNEHEDLMQALRKRDRAASSVALRRHIRNAWDAFVKHLVSLGQSDRAS